MFEVYYCDEDVWQEISIRKVLKRLSNTYTYLGIVFHLAPSIAGLKATSKALDDAETFTFGTGPDVMAQRLQEVVGGLMLAQGEVAYPLDADWLNIWGGDV